MRLRDYADTVSGREQLAVRGFADALEVIPRTLAENAGLDAIEMIVNLRAKHANEGSSTYGLNVFTGEVEDMKENGVVEPLRVKTQAIQSATESAEMLLRIDDVIAAEKLSGGSGGDAGAMGGMGGMGGVGGMM